MPNHASLLQTPERYDSRLPSHIICIGKYKGENKPIQLECNLHGKFIANRAASAYLSKKATNGSCPKCKSLNIELYL